MAMQDYYSFVMGQIQGLSSGLWCSFKNAVLSGTLLSDTFFFFFQPALKALDDWYCCKLCPILRLLKKKKLRKEKSSVLFITFQIISSIVQSICVHDACNCTSSKYNLNFFSIILHMKRTLDKTNGAEKCTVNAARLCISYKQLLPS